MDYMAFGLMNHNMINYVIDEMAKSYKPGDSDKNEEIAFYLYDRAAKYICDTGYMNIENPIFPDRLRHHLYLRDQHCSMYNYFNDESEFSENTVGLFRRAGGLVECDTK